MADRYGEFLEQLEDPTHYVKVSDVPVFDAHREVYHLDRKGRMCSPKTPGARKVVKDFDKKTLSQIAKNCNTRDGTGTLSPLTRGHTVPGEDDESKQPEILGYAKDYRVRWDGRLKKWVIAVNYYLRADVEKEARSYPRTSVELWPGDDVIDPIALLRRTPARDLGQWTYAKSLFSRAAGQSAWRYSKAGRAVLRYALETTPMAEPWEDDVEGEDGDGGAPQGAAPAGDENQMAMEFAKHCMSHPHAQHFAKKYAAEMAPEEEPLPPGADPTLPPEAEEPMMNRKKVGPGRYAKPGSDRAALDAALQREAEAEGRNWVQRLSEIEYLEILDPDAETLRFAKTYRKAGVEGCERYAQHIRSQYRERLDKPAGRVQTALPAGATSPRRGSVPQSIDDLDEAGVAKVRQYRKANKGATFQEAFDAVFPGK